jgi:coenzyme F420-0:L-glutamate ligase/coenzyme F420-1:gamma-L-glutamate ligase
VNIHQSVTRDIVGSAGRVSFIALASVPMVRPGDDLATIVTSALQASNEVLQDGDVLIIAQKIVSKSENRLVELADIVPSAEARRLAADVNKDPRLVELILQESDEVVRSRRDVLIVAQKLGLVIANAGIDQSNIEQDGSDGAALLLPKDPDRTCREIAQELKRRTGVEVGVIINDSHGRAFRQGAVGVAIGSFGIAALSDLRGAPDLFKRNLKSTEVGVADEIASAASLLMGQANEGRPVILARGLSHMKGNGCAADLVRPKAIDLFRAPAEPDLMNLLGARRSIRRYRDKEVSHKTLEKVLQAAIKAPSAHNRQPWRFAILKDTVTKRRLADAMGERLRQDRLRDGDAPDVVERDVARSASRISGAPVAVIVALTMEEMDRYPDARRMAAEHHMAVQSTAMAIQNMLLAAHAMGLGSSIMCAPLFCPDVVCAALPLPPDWGPQALVTLGYPANDGKPYRRRSLEELAVIVKG